MSDIRDICHEYISSLSSEELEQIRKHYKEKIRTKAKDAEDLWKKINKLLVSTEDEQNLAHILSLCSDNKHVSEMFRNLAEPEESDDSKEEETDSDELNEELTDEELDDDE